MRKRVLKHCTCWNFLDFTSLFLSGFVLPTSNQRSGKCPVEVHVQLFPVVTEQETLTHNVIRTIHCHPERWKRTTWELFRNEYKTWFLSILQSWNTKWVHWCLVPALVVDWLGVCSQMVWHYLPNNNLHATPTASIFGHPHLHLPLPIFHSVATSSCQLGSLSSLSSLSLSAPRTAQAISVPVSVELSGVWWKHGSWWYSPRTKVSVSSGAQGPRSVSKFEGPTGAQFLKSKDLIFTWTSKASRNLPAQPTI